MRTVTQSSMVREAENGEEGDEEGAEFGEEDLFHQQVGPGRGWEGSLGRTHTYNLHPWALRAGPQHHAHTGCCSSEHSWPWPVLGTTQAPSAPALLGPAVCSWRWPRGSIPCL